MGRTEGTNSDTTAYVVPNAYAVIPGASEEVEMRHSNHYAGAKPVAAAFVQSVQLDQPAPYRSNFQHIPEARELTWQDDFFEDESDVVAVFDLDYEQMESYYERLSWVGYGATFLFPSCFWCLTFAGTPCYLRRNVQWAVRSQHVAITRDGVRFVKERRPTCWGMPCSDAGKMSKTIPFDQITDCDIVEPAGNTCFCVPNTLHTVHIDTASSGSDSRQHELNIVGLQNPQEFKKLVWAMKRQTAVPSAQGMMDRTQCDGKDDIAALLRDIRDELRRNNEALLNVKVPPAASAPALDLV